MIQKNLIKNFSYSIIHYLDKKTLTFLPVKFNYLTGFFICQNIRIRFDYILTIILGG